MAGKALVKATKEVERSRNMDYWPESYASAEYLDEDEEILAPVEYSDIAYDQWNIEMSLRATGVREEHWNSYLRLRSGADKIEYDGQEPRYLTLLYRVCTSGSHHDRYNDALVSLYTGYLREIVEIYGANVGVSYYLVQDLGGLGSWYISGLLYHYRCILLDGDGYFWFSGEEDSTDED